MTPALRIVDIGASGGIHPRWERLGTPIQTYAFEPDPREFERLKNQLPAGSMVFNSALSDQAGERDFHLCRKQEVSSTFEPNHALLEQFPEVERFDVLKKITLKTDTLDHVLSGSSVHDVDFIKIDTQGHELAILKGGSHTLESTVGLEIEVEFAPMYVGQPLFAEIHSWVTAKGFHLFDIKRGYWKRKGSVTTLNKKGELIYGDALYFRLPEEIVSLPALSSDKIVRSALTYLAYGYADMARALLEGATRRSLLSPTDAATLASLVKRSQPLFLFPDFKGKWYLYKFFLKLAKWFALNNWHAGDTRIGND